MWSGGRRACCVSSTIFWVGPGSSVHVVTTCHAGGFTGAPTYLAAAIAAVATVVAAIFSSITSAVHPVRHHDGATTAATGLLLRLAAIGMSVSFLCCVCGVASGPAITAWIGMRPLAASWPPEW